ncbi:MAG TPA: CRISPR-associated endonuclease Cas2 [Firmicutes bacterium]|nr:CRISPR-associated endonuclease Cas2 [Candidatus Fermentithermobacillaceae bacterium]
MCTLVIYDIVEDKARRRIAEVCKDYGLERIQYSAFFGLTDRNRREEMMLKFRRILGDTEGNIQMYVICEKDIRLKKELSVNGYDPYRAEELRTRAAG